MDTEQLIRIHNYKNIHLHNLYYNKSKNQFYLKKNKNTNIYIPLRWEKIHRKYTKKKNNENTDKIYRYVHICNPETKEKIRVAELEWMNDRDKVIEDNLIQEEIKNTPLEEMWDRILEYITNHTTTENIFDYNSENNTENNTENNSENNTETTEPNPQPEEESPNSE